MDELPVAEYEKAEITCRAVVELLLDYLSDELPQAESATIDRHLAKCPDCVAYLTSYRDAIKLGKAALAKPAGPVKEPIAEELVQAILAAARKSKR